MNELTTEKKTQVIVFHDGSYKFITDQQAALIFQASTTSAKSITTFNLGFIQFSAIAKVISVNDFYIQYPEKREEQSRDMFSGLYSEYAQGNQQIRQPAPRARELMLQGMRQTFRDMGKNEMEVERCLDNFISAKG